MAFGESLYPLNIHTFFVLNKVSGQFFKHSLQKKTNTSNQLTLQTTVAIKVAWVTAHNRFPLELCKRLCK